MSIKLIANNSLNNQNKILKQNAKQLDRVHNFFKTKNGIGKEMLGWLDWPNNYNDYQKDLIQIKAIVNQWKKMHINKIVIIGIGGSYIGIKAGIDLCLSKLETEKFIFISSIDEWEIDYYQKLLIKNNWAIIVISKSGKTLETSINFRFFREMLKKQYHKEHYKRIACITEKDNNSLMYKIATKNKYHILGIPKNIGGRFSTFTNVGLLVFAIANLNIVKMINTYQKCIKDFLEKKWLDPLHYANWRNYFLKKDKKNIEVFSIYEKRHLFLAEHYKQIFAESEGKTTNCLVPTIANYSNDLHSIGQLYQEGSKTFFETHLYLNNEKNESINIPISSFNNDDHLSNLKNKTIKNIINAISVGVINAHSKIAKNPCLEIKMNANDEENFVQIMLFLNIAASCSAYLLKVNPFNQPGVEAYKHEITKILK